LTQGLGDGSDHVNPGQGKTGDAIVHTMYSIPSLYTWVHIRVIEAPVGSSRGGGAIVPVRAIGGLIEVLQSLSLSRWDFEC